MLSLRTALRSSAKNARWVNIQQFPTSHLRLHHHHNEPQFLFNFLNYFYFLDFLFYFLFYFIFYWLLGKFSTPPFNRRLNCVSMARSFQISASYWLFYLYRAWILGPQESIRIDGRYRERGKLWYSCKEKMFIIIILLLFFFMLSHSLPTPLHLTQWNSLRTPQYC